jgi:predicted small secreted protein
MSVRNHPEAERLSMEFPQGGMRGAKRRRMKPHAILKVVSLLGLMLGAFAVSGCHTMEGAGRDIEKAGEKIQDAADK